MNDPLQESAAQSLKADGSASRQTVTAASEPSHVTVYARGAEVSRALEGIDVPAQAFELRVPDITEFADPSSFRFDLGQTERELVSVRTEVHYPSDIGSFGDTVEALEEVRRELRHLIEQRSIVERRKQELQELEFAPGRHEDDYDASERAARGIEIAQSAAQRIAAYDAEIIELFDQIFETQRRQAHLQLEDEQASDVDRAGTTRPRRVVIAQFRAGEAESWSAVKLSYVVKAARWWPVYRVDLTDQGRRAAMGVEALVAQNSGEDWQNVTMSFSTSDLDFDARLPGLLSLRLGRAQAAAPTGFRPPPKGTDMLFASYDQAYGGVRASTGAPRPPMSVAKGSVGQAAPREEFADVLEEETNEYEVSAVELQAWDEIAASADAPAPQAAMAPQRSMARKKSMASSFFGGGGSPPPSSGAAPVAKKRKRPSVPESPAHNAEPESGWLDFDNLRMSGPGSPQRGKLAAEDRMYSRADTLASANETALKLEAVDPVVSRGSFDYRYDTDGLADVPSDGMVHRLTVTTAETESKLSWRVVPREDESVYRVAELDNPHDSPLLTGPVEVYADGGLVTTTTISHIARGGSMTIGLGVDERIRAARNARVEEESAGLLGGKREVLHQVEIELRSNLGFDADVHVFDRVPVTDDDDVSVELVSSAPGHQTYDQKKEGQPIRGGLQWSVLVAAGTRTTIEFSYKIVLRAKDEIIGGNRRE